MANSHTPVPPDLGVIGTRLESTERNVTALTENINRMASEWRTTMLDRSEQFRKEMSDQTTAFNTKIENLSLGFNNKLETLNANISSQITGIASDIKKKSEIPWPALGVIFTAMSALILVLYWPIQTKQNDLTDANKSQDARVERLIEAIAAENKERNAALTALNDTVTKDYISRREFENLSARGKEERERTTRSIEHIQANVFPKEVHEQRWARFDGDISALNLRTETQVQNLQREIDALQRLLGDQFTARDALLENKDRISKLEELIRDIISKPQSRSYP